MPQLPFDLVSPYFGPWRHLFYPRITLFLYLALRNVNRDFRFGSARIPSFRCKVPSSIHRATFLRSTVGLLTEYPHGPARHQRQRRRAEQWGGRPRPRTGALAGPPAVGRQRLASPVKHPPLAASQEPVDLRGCGVHDLLQVAVHGLHHILDGLAAGWLFALEGMVPNAAVGLGVD